jgi:hypothetical protein
VHLLDGDVGEALDIPSAVPATAVAAPAVMVTPATTGRTGPPETTTTPTAAAAEVAPALDEGGHDQYESKEAISHPVGGRRGRAQNQQRHAYRREADADAPDRHPSHGPILGGNVVATDPTANALTQPEGENAHIPPALALPD